MSVATPRLPATVVGASAGPRVLTVDARWLIAYAAALGETDPRFYDTAGAGPIGHPLFAVCYEWPLAVDLRERVIGPTIAARSVHLTHDLVLHRLPRAGDRLSTTARVAEAVPRRAGTLVVVALETTDAGGAIVSTTRYGSLYRGVPLELAGQAEPHQDVEASGAAVRGERPIGGEPSGDTADARGDVARPPIEWEESVEVAAGAAHVYTECSRIWNPIHTDPVVARAAGLPGIILHGTATLALAVSRVVAREAGGEPAAVRGVRARFTGMVMLPSTLVVRGRGRRGGQVLFDAMDGGGRSVLGEGVVST